jgi:hypothetical protein
MVSTISSGVLSWPILIIGMILLGFRKPLQYAAVIVGACIAGLPYALYVRPPAFRHGNFSPFNAKLVLNMLGRPFTNGIGSHFGDMWVGIWMAFGGVVLLAIGLFLVWKLCRRVPFRQFAPALMMTSFGLLFCWQVSFVRVSVAPWYAANAMDFWIGLVALAYFVWAFRKTTHQTSPLTSIAFKVWPPLAVLVVMVLFVISNRTHSDKSFFMWTRAPASVACLQQYKIAPTYCGPLVHRFAGVPRIVEAFAKPLHTNGLSVFGSEQTWTLQGDSILPTVSYSDVPGIPETRWSEDLSTNAVPITDYRKLNLIMHSSNSVDWMVLLPSDMKEGRFYSSLDLSSSPPTMPADGRLQFLISAIHENGQEQQLFSQHLTRSEPGPHAFSIDLIQYAGQTLTLRFRSVVDGNSAGGAWAVLSHPYIEARLERPPPPEQSPTIAPSNTEVSPFRVDPAPEDFRFNINDQNLWDVTGLTQKQSGTQPAQPAAGWVIAGGRAAVTYKGALKLPMADYSHFYVRTSASVNLQPRSFAVIYALRDANGTLQRRTVIVPLLPDEGMHSYTFDLRLNGPKAGFELVEFGILPAYAFSGIGPTIHIEEIRLIRRKASPPLSGETTYAAAGSQPATLKYRVIIQ